MENNNGRPSENKNSSPKGEQFTKINVSKEVAKLANVGTGTLARYDVVMKSDMEKTNGLRQHRNPKNKLILQML